MRNVLFTLCITAFASPVIADRLGEFGCEVDFDGWICEGEIPNVVLFCNGP